MCCVHICVVCVGGCVDECLHVCLQVYDVLMVFVNVMTYDTDAAVKIEMVLKILVCTD